ncbi:hypothetical protein BDB01DRAFT_790985 [Pilobolus umbonatus]|nr:hypothetical protein BDB01DRAFT_790985 [Pilobolus umbonatus]
MAENNLFQFAQVIAELPISPQQPSNDKSSSQHHLHIRKNACVVCSICFTCSKYYGIDCRCQEQQPRRGKNLPDGGLDSRAKKLNKDQDDYEFSLKWINENAHKIYKDNNNNVIGLRELPEVSLCKAHSSTLYRAKKKHERSRGSSNLAPPSPADSTNDHRQYQYHHPSSPSPYMSNPYPMDHSISTGGLAAKVKEISNFHQQQPYRTHEVPDFSRMSHSSSVKRKRSSNQMKSPILDQRPNSSLSTPLYGSSRVNPFLQQHSITPSASTNHVPPSHDYHSHMQSQQQQSQLVDNFPSQLPPLHSRSHSTTLSSLPSALQKQVQISNTNTNSNNHHLNNHSDSGNHSSSSSLLTRPFQSTQDTPDNYIPMVIETVSLRPATPDVSNYYFRNLAITDTFTFRDLLAEIDMTGSPPRGKRIVITNSDRIYPLDQRIRDVIRRPHSTHLDLCLGLIDKPSINWNTYA